MYLSLYNVAYFLYTNLHIKNLIGIFKLYYKLTLMFFNKVGILI